MSSTEQIEHARALDEQDPLRPFRALFAMPHAPGPGGRERESVYLCGNSLGLMPKAAREAVVRELDDWAALGVEGHFKDRDGWYAYHELVREPLARLVGARPREVVAMNSLTVNLHLLMASFYRPENWRGGRRAILIESPCFPSDVYAVKSQLRLHHIPEEEGLARIRPREGEHTLRAEELERFLERDGSRVALLLLAGVNYVTGQRMDIERITAAAHRAGCIVGWDLAHAAGNVPLALHHWNVDFAAWCSYKYLNSGPGAIAGAFVHERHLSGESHRLRPRFEGWWGNDPASRFEMSEEFVPVESADAWQLSNPPILALAPLKTSLSIFDRAGMTALREKSEKLSAYLLNLLDESGRPGFEIITPRDPAARGCQLSIRVPGDAKSVLTKLMDEGIIADFRRPDVIRVAPAPLYNSFEDCRRFAAALLRVCG